MGTFVPGAAQPKQFQDVWQIVATGTTAGTATGAFTANTSQSQVIAAAGVALGDFVEVAISVDATTKQISGYANAAGSITILYSPEASTTALGAHNVIWSVKRLNPQYT